MPGLRMVKLFKAFKFGKVGGIRAVALVGALPPPYGGVRVHMDRLTRRLVEAGVPYRLYCTEGRFIPERHCIPGGKSPMWLVKFLMTVREKVVHFQTNKMLAIVVALMILSLRSRKLILSFQSEAPMRQYHISSAFHRMVWRLSIRKVSHVFCSNQNIFDWLGDLGIQPEQRSLAIAFIPPSKPEVAYSRIPNKIVEFLSTHSPIIGTHGSFGYFLNGLHVYSFDMIIELMERIRKEHSKVGFYTLISVCYDKDHQRGIFEKRKRLGLEENWLILSGLPDAEAISLYARSDLFVRPSITDGDSVSIREFLCLGVPVVASDAVPRPAGCVLFKNRDMKSLEDAVDLVLRDLDSHRKRVSRLKVEDPTGRIIKIYKECLSNSI